MLTDERKKVTDEYARQEWVKYLRECDNPIKMAEEVLLGLFAVAEKGFDDVNEQRAHKAITMACLEVLGKCGVCRLFAGPKLASQVLAVAGRKIVSTIVGTKFP